MHTCNVYIVYVCVESIPLYERSLTSWLVRDGCSRHVKHANGFDIIIVCDGRTDGLGVDNAFCSRVRTVYTACPGSILYIDFYHMHTRVIRIHVLLFIIIILLFDFFFFLPVHRLPPCRFRPFFPVPLHCLLYTIYNNARLRLWLFYVLSSVIFRS